MDLKFSWPTQKLENSLSEMNSNLASSPRPYSLHCNKVIDTLVEEHNILEAKIWLSSGIAAFLYLYTTIHGFKSSKTVVTSDLPLGSGLGSSASFFVAISFAFLSLSNAINMVNKESRWFNLWENELDLINKLAYEGENIIHGKPYGIDNAVSTYRSMIMFISGELTRFKSSTPLKMLITNIEVGRNTKALVDGVSERAFRHLEAMTSVFNAVNHISREMSTTIESPTVDDLFVTSKEEKIEKLMETNQELLQCMGVSHASVETVLRTTLKYKLASKLTRAGGGGCVLTLLPTLLSTTVVNKVIAELEPCRFQCLKAEVGGKGLEICYN